MMETKKKFHQLPREYPRRGETEKKNHISMFNDFQGGHHQCENNLLVCAKLTVDIFSFSPVPFAIDAFLDNICLWGLLVRAEIEHYLVVRK